MRLKAKASPATVGLGLLAASEVPNFLSGLLPSLFTIQHFMAQDGDVPEDTLRSIRRGELLGGALAVMVGAGASLVARDPLPLYATVIILVVLLFAYEHALRNPHLTTELM